MRCVSEETERTSTKKELDRATPTRKICKTTNEKMFTPTQTYEQITTKDGNTQAKAKTEVINNEPTNPN